jgi:ADP-ribose pyrophosphatase
MIASMAYELVGKRQLYRGQRISLELHDLADEDTGQKLTKEVVAHPGAVVIVPLLENGDVILIRNKRWATGHTLLELPAGGLEPTEPPINAAGRELLEETGYLAGKMKHLASFYTSPGILSELMHAFVATDLVERKTKLEAGEEIELAPMPLGEAIEAIRDGRIKDGKTIAALLMHDKFGLRPNLSD